ncbi:MAG: non-ribosomal peptide synthetase [Alphaproteobacteria bacterium]|nr:non-ribosomal peptide synthetase [Alphaproteobacteria bacterium]
MAEDGETSALQAGGIASVFARIARFTPTARAIVQGDRQAWTYGDLDAASGRVATRLRMRGVQPGDRVGIMASRSMETVAALLGVIKVGAVFVPMDPVYPPGQLAWMLKDSAPKLTIFGKDVRLEVRSLVSAGESASLEGLLETSGKSADAFTPFPAAPDDPVYIMYTSGSSGIPKGVVVPQRGVARLVSGQNYCDLSPAEVVLHVSPLAFDASTFEIWGALLNGGTLAIVANDHPSLADIGAAIARHGVTTAWLTAGLFHLMVDEAIDQLRPLRQLLAGGDVLSPSHVGKALACLPGCRIINGYGPTENTTFTCCHAFARDGEPLRSAPIGRPVSGTHVYILGEDLHPVADGDAGQLAACGSGLAIGYHNQPALTAERFVTLPVHPHERAYLTGDMARRGAGGAIEFLGRSDRQIKIGGKRVEPGEIEQALREHADILDAAVVASARGVADKEIVAFVAPRHRPAANDLAAKTLRRMRDDLPAHMAPSRVIVVNALPLTANGKVDRAALSARLKPVDPDPGPLARAVGLPGGDSLEVQVARVWCEVLGLATIPADVNFFDLGGRSLQLMQVHARLLKALGFDFPLQAMFEHSRIDELSRYLRGTFASPGLAPAVHERAARSRAALQRRRLGKGIAS